MSERAVRRPGPLVNAVAAVLALAIIAAVLVGFKPSLSPPGLHARTLSSGSAQGEVLVDTRASQVAEVVPYSADTLRKAGQLAISYALYLQSEEATRALGQAVGLHGQSVAASGPFTLLLGREAIAAERPAPPNPILVDDRYRLLLDVDGERPMLTIYATAPTAAAAITMVATARQVLAEHVAEGQPAGGGGPESVTLRMLGPVTGGTVGTSARRQLMIFVFLLVLLVGATLIYARRLRTVRVARARAALAALDSLDDPTGELDEWPHTRRILPWALAAFMVMIFLVPFEAVTLPVNLPLSSTADRPVLLALIALWLLSIAIVSGEARPQVQLTRVHIALFVFLAICCLGVVLNASALANMGEVSLSGKKLVLLGTYIAFFVVVASVMRPREVPRFAALMVGLGVIVAIATVVEYRMHVNVFYEVWRKILPVTIPEGLDGRDSIGRLNVFGPTDEPLELAAMLAMVLPFAIIGSIDAATRRRRILYTIAIGLLIAGGVATSRKTSLVAPVGAILLLMAYRPRTIARSMLGLAVVLGVIVHLTSPGALGSVLTQLEPGHVNSVHTTTDRTARYSAVAPDLISHPLIGRGYESYDPHKYRILDNEYLGLLITTGLIGVLAYLAIFASMMSTAHRTIRGPDPRRASLALAAFASVGVVALASALFDVLSFPHVPYLLLFVAGMIVALREPTPATHPVKSAGARPAPLPLPDGSAPDGGPPQDDQDAGRPTRRPNRRVPVAAG